MMACWSDGQTINRNADQFPPDQLTKDIQDQIGFLEDELQRVKDLINRSDYNVLSAPYQIVNRYRQEIKQQLKLLYENLQ